MWRKIIKSLKLEKLFSKLAGKSLIKDDSLLQKESSSEEEKYSYALESEPKDRELKPVDFVIGLDFGTSSTKVAVRTPFELNKRIVMAKINSSSKGLGSYLLPTKLFIESDGKLSLNDSRNARQVIDMKVRLFNSVKETGNDTKSIQESFYISALTSGYIALVLKKVKEWFENTESRYYQHAIPRWQVNIGIPSAGYDDEKMRNTWMKIARAAWWLHDNCDGLTENECINIFYAVDNHDFDFGLHPESLSVIPEVAAEVVGYARSAFRSIGLHLLIDIGATTVDVCGFILHEYQGDDRYSLLTGDVQKLGAFELHKYRVENILKLFKDRGYILAPITEHNDPLIIYPNKAYEYISSPLNKQDKNLLESIDDKFKTRCGQMIGVTIKTLKSRRDPNSPFWREGLPVFIAGGGSRQQIYHDVLQEMKNRVEQSTTIRGFKIKTLPKPSNLANNDINDKDFQFLAVAYGLSHDKIEIGDIRCPSEIEDIKTETRKDWEASFVGKEQT